MECCGDTTKSFKWITPASHRVGTRQAECNCAKWVYSTWEWLERLFCTHQCPNRWSTLYNKKRLVNFNCPLNQDPFGCEIGDCSEIGISVYPAKPATRSYPELPRATRSYLGFRGEAILLASGSPLGQLVSPLLLQLGKSVSIQDHRNEMRRDKSSQHWCSTVFHFYSVILDCRMQDISGWDGRFG